MVDLDPREVEPRLEAKEELRHVPLVDEEHYVSIGMAMAATDAKLIHQALKKNVDLFFLDGVGSQPQRHHTQAVGLQGGTIIRAKEEKSRRKEAGGQRRNQKASSYRVHPRGLIRHLVGQRCHGHQVK